MNAFRLGINIDHVATLRNARGSAYPEPLRAARLAMQAGADGITAHLREDRRHIRDSDIAALAGLPGVPLNLEMAATEEMVEIAARVRPYSCCFVPENRAEITTEGGLDVAGQSARLAPLVQVLQRKGIRVSLFVAPDRAQLKASADLGVPDVELHTGGYADAVAAGQREAIAPELDALQTAARDAAALGLEVHAGHGLTYDNVAPVAAIREIVELQIGHFLIGEAVFVGLEAAIGRMRALIGEVRQENRSFGR